FVYCSPPARQPLQRPRPPTPPSALRLADCVGPSAPTALAASNGALRLAGRSESARDRRPDFERWRIVARGIFLSISRQSFLNRVGWRHLIAAAHLALVPPPGGACRPCWPLETVGGL